MLSARILAPLSIALTLVACAAEPPPGPSVVILPGNGKDLAAFQQDDLICKGHALAHTGYAGPAPAVAGGAANDPPSAGSAGALHDGQGAGTAVTANATGNQYLDGVGYVQCMAARGDVVQTQPNGTPYQGYDAGYAYPYPYGDAYTYVYPNAYPFGYYGGGAFIGLGSGWGWYGRGHGHWEHGGWGHGGFAHGGGGRGGFAGGGHH
jgi:hypothetical protein